MKPETHEPHETRLSPLTFSLSPEFLGFPGFSSLTVSQGPSNGKVSRTSSHCPSLPSILPLLNQMSSQSSIYLCLLQSSTSNHDASSTGTLGVASVNFESLYSWRWHWNKLLLFDPYSDKIEPRSRSGFFLIQVFHLTPILSQSPNTALPWDPYLGPASICYAILPALV